MSFSVEEMSAVISSSNKEIKRLEKEVADLKETVKRVCNENGDLLEIIEKLEE